MVPALTIQRLAFIRFLYEQGIDQANQPAPLSATAVLSLHDATELFLGLAAEHLEVNVRTSTRFLEYWERLESRLPAGTQLPSKNAMDRMNTTRVEIKHHGTIPSTHQIEQIKADVTTFLIDATRLVFALDFAGIDLADMVARQETCDGLRAAQSHADAGDYVAALAGLVVAFDEMVLHYCGHGFGSHEDPLSFGPTIRPLTTWGSTTKEIDHLKELSRASAAMQRALRLLALGIDYPSYAQFQTITPRVTYYAGSRTSYETSPFQDPPTYNAYHFCRRFVIESALRAANTDAVIDARMRRPLTFGDQGHTTPVVQGTWSGAVGEV